MKETLANHCVSVWDGLHEHSREDGEYVVYDGNLTKVFDDLGISRTYYSLIWAILEEGGFVSRTGQRSASVLLHRRPSIDVLLLTDQPSGGTVSLVRRIEALEAALGGVDLVGILGQLEGRIKMLESAHKGTTEGEHT